MQRKGSAYYHVRRGTWTPLGSDYARALVRWAEIEGAAAGNRTVNTLLDAYWTSNVPRTLSAQTRKLYEIYTRSLRRVFGEAPVGELRRGHVAEYIARSKSAANARNSVGFLHRVYALAVEWEWVAANPCDGVTRPPPARRTRYLTDDELAAILGRLDGAARLACEFAYLTGARVSEVCEARFTDIRDGVLYLRRRKTADVLPIRLDGGIAELIEEAKAIRRPVRSMHIFVSVKGSGFAPDTLSGIFSDAARAAGVQDAVFHDLRRKSATDRPSDAQDRLGHSDGRITRRVYIAHPAPVRPLERKK